jgi:hypothetical protein
MRHLRALPVLTLCALILFTAALPASAATPPDGNQPANPEPVTPANPDTSQIATPADTSAFKFKLYLPSVAVGPTATVSAIELTQATQNVDHSVPMVANRPTVARVFLQFDGGLTGQTVQLSATRNGVALAGSPMQRTGAIARSAPNRANPADSTNFLLPAAWLKGSVVLTARVMPNGKALARTATFQTVAPLRVMVVPIRYVHAPTNKTFAAPTTVQVPAAVQRMFPIPSVDIRWHAPLTYRGNLTASASNRLAGWSELLNTVLALKQSEGAANDMVYMAVLPTSIRSENSIYYTGIGSSMRGTVNFDTNLTPAHELGHALGRAHAPCGGVVNADPNYPYAGASIGALGFDTSNFTLIDPAITTDVMSYCSEWISDYTYVGMYQNQRAALAVAAGELEVSETEAWPASANAPAVDAILVRALLDPGSEPTLLPVYAVRAPIAADNPSADGSSAYTVAFVDAAGATLAAHNVRAAEAQEEDLAVRVLSALLPLPPGNVAAVEVREGDRTIARRALQTSAAGAAGPAIAPAMTYDSTTLTMTLPTGAPQLVRLRQGETYTTLGMDVSDGLLTIPTGQLPASAADILVSTADLLPAPGVTAAAAEATTATLSIPDAPPVVAIAPPETPAGGGGIVIPGYASDATDGMLEPAWFVNGEAVGTGPLLQLDDTAQLHFPLIIELRATDSAGNLASASLTLQQVDLQP